VADQVPLWEELDVDTLWVHIMRGMPLDEMGINAIAVYVMLKTYTALDSGDAWPSIPTLARRLKTSDDTIGRALNVLLDLKLIEKHKVGRSNRYNFVEQLPIMTKTDQLPVGQAAVRYLPLQMQAILSQLKDFARTGSSPGINITINLTAITGEHAQVNVNNISMAPVPGEPVSQSDISTTLAGIRRMLKNSSDLKRPRGKS